MNPDRKVFAPLHPKGVIERTLAPSSLVGILDPASIHEFAAPAGQTSADEGRVADARARLPPLEAILNLDDFERAAHESLSRAAWGYYACAGDDGYSSSGRAGPTLAR